MAHKLYLIHCGYYDDEVSNGIYEFHVNLTVAAETIEEAKAKVRKIHSFATKKMHIDGIQEVEQVDGYQIQLIPTRTLSMETKILSHLHRDL